MGEEPKIGCKYNSGAWAQNSKPKQMFMEEGGELVNNAMFNTIFL